MWDPGNLWKLISNGIKKWGVENTLREFFDKP